MNETINTLMNRKSIRAYSDQIIEPEKRQAIIDTARRSPTAGNQQMYSIIEVTDQKMKDKLAVSCDNQPFIAKAPLVLLFLADYYKTFSHFLASGAEKYCSKNDITIRYPGPPELMLGLNDALIAAQTSVIAAESLGIGSCYIGDIMENHEFHTELFDLPKWTFPATLLCFGYPKGAPVGSSKGLSPRYDEEYMVFQNKYHHFEEKSILKLTDPLEKKYYKNGKYHGNAENIGQDFFSRKYMSDFTVEMERSILANLKSWRLEESK